VGLEAFGPRGADIPCRSSRRGIWLGMDEVTPALRKCGLRRSTLDIVLWDHGFGLAKGTGLSIQEAQSYIQHSTSINTLELRHIFDGAVAEAKERGYCDNPV